jgi:hypothetical protein
MRAHFDFAGRRFCVDLDILRMLGVYHLDFGILPPFDTDVSGVIGEHQTCILRDWKNLLYSVGSLKADHRHEKDYDRKSKTMFTGHES